MEPLIESEAELRYCLRLVRDGSTPEVGAAFVVDYLLAQATSARLNKRHADAAAYADAALQWRRGLAAATEQTLMARIIRLARTGKR